MKPAEDPTLRTQGKYYTLVTLYILILKDHLPIKDPYPQVE